jgi:hypothetical protein
MGKGKERRNACGAAGRRKREMTRTKAKRGSRKRFRDIETMTRLLLVEKQN